MRLIDADELYKYCDVEKTKDGLYIKRAKILTPDFIKSLPSVDAVPVVRCKDCKWFYESDTVICCEKHTGLALARKDDYCSHGERRNDD